MIKHDNGLATVYMHMDTIEVKEGQEIAAGQKIGKAGDQGTGGVHLHFGVRQWDHPSKDTDPFGWWSTAPDPWNGYGEYGQPSAWLWRGDEAKDGYLTVDNRESQAQLFRYPFEKTDWHRVDQGYQGEAWYAIMNLPQDQLGTYWAIWGTYIKSPGYYQVQAYWPSDPDSQEDPVPARKVAYTLYYHDPQGQVQSLTLYADQNRDANRFVTLCAVPYEDNLEECPQYPQIYFGQGASVVILRDVTDEPVPRGKYMVFFDAIRWKPVTPTPTPTPTSTPTLTPTPTPTPVPQIWTEVPLAIESLRYPGQTNSTITLLSENAFRAEFAGDNQFWMGGGVTATVREVPVGIIFYWDGSDNYPGKRMCKEPGAPPYNINATPCAWENTSDQLVDGWYCSATHAGPYTPGEICGHVLGGQNYTLLHFDGNWSGNTRRGLGWEQQAVGAEFTVSSIQLIYYSAPLTPTPTPTPQPTRPLPTWPAPPWKTPPIPLESGSG